MDSIKKTNICHDVFADKKTPKMLVNERCVKLKVGVKWDTMPVSGAEQQQQFRSVCKISPNGSDIPSEISGEGFGASKKDAEQIAAWKVLHYIYSYKELFEMTSPGKIMKTINENQKQLHAVPKNTNDSGEVVEDPVSDTDDDKIVGEPIGELLTLCRRHKIEDPGYQEAEVKDKSKRSIFVVTCKVGSRCTHVGRRYNKKDAKRIASHRALKDLGSQGFTTASKKVKSGNSESEEPSGAKRLKKAIEEVTSTVCNTSFCNTGETGASTSAPNISCTDRNPSDDDDDFYDASSQDLDPPRPPYIVLLDEVSELSENVSVCEPVLPVPVEGSSDVNEKDEDKAKNRPMESGTGITTGGKKKKRKFELKIGDEYYDSPVVKRKYLEDISRLMMKNCQNKVENCLKFVKDISHIVHHCRSTATAKNILVLPEEKLRGGPLKILKELVVELNVTLRFTGAVKLKTSETEPNVKYYCVFSKLIFRVASVQRCQKIHQFYGRGQSANEAKENASLEALKFIQLLKLVSNEQ